VVLLTSLLFYPPLARLPAVAAALLIRVACRRLQDVLDNFMAAWDAEIAALTQDAGDWLYHSVLSFNDTNSYSNVKASLAVVVSGYMFAWLRR